jgi:hypothetical protein
LQENDVTLHHYRPQDDYLMPPSLEGWLNQDHLTRFEGTPSCHSAGDTCVWLCDRHRRCQINEVLSDLINKEYAQQKEKSTRNLTFK